MLALKDSLAVKLPPSCVRARFLVVPADEQHAIVEPCPSAVLLYLAPESAAGRRVRAMPRTAILAGPSLDEASLATLVQDRKLAKAADTLLNAIITADAPLHRLDVRTERALDAIEATLERDGDVRLPAIARAAGVSASQLSHSFAREVGLPLRPYVRWLRLQRAAAALRRGDNLTVAAHEAGFADAAHLSRVFHRMFGIRPSDLASFAEWVDG